MVQVVPAEIVNIDASEERLADVVAALRAGALVGVPTETVYGLAADALNPAAVARIFAAKGRPANHPLIVHVPASAALDEAADDVPAVARLLAERFWPGPLTMVLRKSARVPDAVTGGLPTVGLRCPDQPHMKRLLAAFGGWLAAPSANRFKGVSPTTAQHVVDDLGDHVAFVVDGGPCALGIESTIVDVTVTPVMVLRPGALPFEALEQALGAGNVVRRDGDEAATPSPGQLAAHYQPRARVVVVPGEDIDKALAAHPDAMAVRIDGDLPGFAQRLYAAFRQADAQGRATIVVEEPPAEGLGEALRDRLARAAHGNGGALE